MAAVQPEPWLWALLTNNINNNSRAVVNAFSLCETRRITTMFTETLS
jgi:hypothetical protein